MFNDNKTFSVRLHGYGGQGIKSMASILAKAAISSGLHAQAFPEFGPERRGAPVKAYARFSIDPIMTRAHIEKPNFIIIMDTNTLNIETTTEGMGNETYFLINTDSLPQEVKKEFSLMPDHHRISCIDAASAVAEYDNKVHTSIPVIGRFIRITELVPLEKIKEILSREFIEKIGEEKTKLTEKAIEEAYYKI
jgi:2-oxoacid:acceptor oxidoreductase gamma subunit (pyruvate/2-ketoisovalerate family)